MALTKPMLNLEQINQLAQREELRKRTDAPLCIWITGPSGAGKTFVMERLKAVFQERGTLSTFSDGAQIVEEVRRDIEGLYHVKDGEGFIVTNTMIDDRVQRKLNEEIERFQGDFFLIELARGRDSQGQRDLSFRRLLANLTEKTLTNSVFIYLSCPYAERVRRNQFRASHVPDGKHRKVNSTAMERFFQEDDFGVWRKSIPCPIIVLDNS